MGEEYNLDLCPACDAELEVADSFDQTTDDDVGPLQGHRLGCSECDHECIAAILHYPNGPYIGVWEAHEEKCLCGNDATYGIDRVDKPPMYQCGFCVFDLYSSAYVDSVRLL